MSAITTIGSRGSLHVDGTGGSKVANEATIAAAVPQLRASQLGALGIEAIAGQLIVESGHQQSRANRALARDARDEQARHLLEQHQHQLDKAHAMRAQGWAMMATGVVAAATSMIPGLSSGISTFGNGIAKTHQADADVSEACATLAAAEAKFCEGDRDEVLTVARQAQGMVDKALGAIQAIAAEQSASRRAILRGG